MHVTLLVSAWVAVALVAIVCTAIVLLVLVSKISDRKRQRYAPNEIFEMEAQPGTVSLEALPPRRPPIISSGADERCARLVQVAPRMRSGDPGTFSGREFHSYLIRIPTWSSKSHAYILDVENEGCWNAVPYIIDTTLKHGVSRRPLIDEVTKYPGQWYWSPVRGEASRHYKRDHAIELAMEMVKANTQYGWPAIVLQTLIKLPLSASVLYLTGVGNSKFFKRWPFCSGALAIWMRKGAMDICMDRAPEFIVPQDVDQCPLFEGWVALFP